MGHSIIGTLAKAIAAGYGLLALAVAAMYSLTRKEAWQKASKEDKQFRKACDQLWSLSENNNDLSHHFLTLQNGLQLHYLSSTTVPKSSGSLMIFLHGFPDTCYLWEQPLRSDIAQKARLVALDLPGCGGSDSHSKYGPDEILNAVAEAVVQLKDRYLESPSTSASPKRCVLVSHDWGGAIAFRLAGETSGLVDEVVVMNSTYPFATRENVASLLSRSRDAIQSGQISNAWPHLKPILSQLLKSNYIFMLNLPLPLARWMPWLATSLVKLCHRSALRSSPHAAEATCTRSLASSYGPGPANSTSQNPDGSSYGETVRLRAQANPQGDWDERVRIYGEGLALGKWTPNYPGYQPPLWKAAPESMRKGQFSYPVHFMFGMQDVALDPRVVLDGIENFMLDAHEGMRKAQVDADGVELHAVGRSSVVKLPACGHWSMLEEQGRRALGRLLLRLFDSH